MDNLPKNGAMKFDKFTCTNTALGRHFQLTSQTPVFNTSQFSFVLTMQNIIFLFLADWYFAYETMIRQPEGMDG